MSIDFNLNKNNSVVENKSVSNKNIKDKPDSIEKKIKEVSENKSETLNIDKKNTIGQKAFASINFVGSNLFINDSVNKIKNLISDEKLTDNDETEINKIFSTASQKNNLNQLIQTLNQKKNENGNLLEQIILKWDSHLPKEDIFYIGKRVFNELILGNDYKQPENLTPANKIFNTIFLDKNLTYENGKVVADYFNKNYTGVGVVIGEDIQNNFLFLLMDNKPEKLSKGTLETAKYVFSNENLKPDHLQRVAVGKKILNDYLNGK